MKKIYIILLLVVTFTVSAQESTNSYGLVNTEISDFKLYPNPVYNGLVHITTKNNEEKDITIYNVFGEIVLQERIKVKSLNISRLVPGVYVVRVTENQKSINRKLVVK